MSKIKEFIEKNQPKKLIFDFDGVKFFSSQVLGMLSDIRAKLEKHNGNVTRAARAAAINRSTFASRMRKLNIKKT